MDRPPQGPGPHDVDHRSVVVDGTQHADVVLGEEIEDRRHRAVTQSEAGWQDDVQERVVVGGERFRRGGIAVGERNVARHVLDDAPTGELGGGAVASDEHAGDRHRRHRRVDRWTAASEATDRDHALHVRGSDAVDLLSATGAQVAPTLVPVDRVAVEDQDAAVVVDAVAERRVLHAPHTQFGEAPDVVELRRGDRQRCSDHHPEGVDRLGPQVVQTFEVTLSPGLVVDVEPLEVPLHPAGLHQVEQRIVGEIVDVDESAQPERDGEIAAIEPAGVALDDLAFGDHVGVEEEEDVARGR